MVTISMTSSLTTVRVACSDTNLEDTQNIWKFLHEMGREGVDSVILILKTSNAASAWQAMVV